MNWTTCLTLWLLGSSVLLAGSPSLEAGVSPAEVAWLADHEEIRVGLQELPPVAMAGTNATHWSGLGLDYLRLLADRLGFQVRLVPFRSQSMLLDAARNHDVDLLLTVDEQPSRRAYLRFSPPYYERRQVVVTRGSAVAGFESLAQFTGRTVAVAPSVRNSAALRQLYPRVRFQPVSSEAAALAGTAGGRFAAAVLEGAADTTLPEGLAIAGESPFSVRCAFASRSDWPELASLLRRALADLAPAEIATLQLPYLENQGGGIRSWLWNLRTAVALGGLLLAALLAQFYRRLLRLFAGSIRRNLILLVLAALTPALAIILFIGQERQRELADAGEQAAVGLVDRTAAALQRVARHINVILDATGKNPGLGAVGREEFVSQVNHLLQSMEMLDVFVFDAAGWVVASGKPMSPDVNVSDLAVFREVMNTRTAVVGDAVMSAMYGYPMLHFARPLPGPTNGGPWFVSKVIQLDTLGLEFDPAEYPPGTRLTVADREGLRLYEYPPRETGGLLGQPLGPELPATLPGPAGGGMQTGRIRQGDHRLFARQALLLPATGEPFLSVLVEVPLQPLQAAAAAFARRNLILLALAALVGLVVAIYMGNVLMAEMLDRITSAARRVGEGQLGARIGLPPNQRGELAALARTFDDMAASLERDQVNRRRLEEERMRLEAQVYQAARLESIGTLASGVAHEINNPINGVMNYAEIIRRRLPEDSPLREFAGEITHETERVATIVRDLLTFARHEKQTHHSTPVRDIVDGTLSLIRTVIRKDDIRLEVDLPEKLPVVSCQSQQIQQVLMNLLTNARDALNARYPAYDPDKAMRLSAGAFEQDGESWVRITVEDHGGGIPPDVRKRMFEPFFSTKARDKGTGLGMSISLGIVQQHHGELRCETEVGEYTRFHLELPVTQEETHKPV